MTELEEKQRLEQIEQGRLLFAKECVFMLSVADLKQLPVDKNVPEIAFVGTSNVGKSSLVNALTGRNSLARASNTPGRTQMLNFFDLGDQTLRLVDMPGYGFAKAPKENVDAWKRLINDYLRGRAVLRRVCLLVDARHGLKKNDLDAMTMMDKAAVVYQLVLTKIDKVGPNALKKLIAQIEPVLATHVAAYPIVFATSADTKQGIPELRASLTRLALEETFR